MRNDPAKKAASKREELAILGRRLAKRMERAAENYLDSCLPEVVRLPQRGLSDDALGRHPLMRMLRAHGSRGWEEAVD